MILARRREEVTWPVRARSPRRTSASCASLRKPAYHPLYAHADPELIGLIDELFAHGNLRNWAAFTDSALRLGPDVDHRQLDERLTRNVFALHGGADR